MPKGHSLSIYAQFWAKRELHCIFLGKKVIIIIIITSKHGTTIFFSHLSLGKRKKKNWPKKRT